MVQLKTHIWQDLKSVVHIPSSSTLTELEVFMPKEGKTKELGNVSVSTKSNLT